MNKHILRVGWYACLLLVIASCEDATEAELLTEVPAKPGTHQSLGLQSPTEYIYFRLYVAGDSYRLTSQVKQYAVAPLTYVGQNLATGTRLYARIEDSSVVGFVLKKDGVLIAVDDGCATCGPSQGAQPKLVSFIEKVYTDATQTYRITTKRTGASPWVEVKMSAAY